MTFEEYIFRKFDRWAEKSPWWLQEMIDNKYYPSLNMNMREMAEKTILEDAIILLAEENRKYIQPKKLVEKWIKRHES